MEEGSGADEGRFRIFPEALVAADPGEDPFTGSSAWMNGKAGLIRPRAHHLYGKDRGAGRFFVRIAHVVKAFAKHGKVRQDGALIGSVIEASQTVL